VVQAVGLGSGRGPAGAGRDSGPAEADNREDQAEQVNARPALVRRRGSQLWAARNASTASAVGRLGLAPRTVTANAPAASPRRTASGSEAP